MVAYMLPLAMKKIIVVDTNVLVGAFIGSGGANREVVRRCLLGKYKPLISNALFREYEDVVVRESVKKRCPLDDVETRDLLNAFYSVCTWVSIRFLWRPNLRDEGDNFLIELAVAGNGNAIVTNNVRDFSGAELHFEYLKILKPEQLLKGE